MGKTTLARQVIEAVTTPSRYASADEAAPRDRAWLEAEWGTAHLLARESRGGALLVLDEVQKVRGWSDAVKAEWDRDSRDGLNLRVLVLGSSPLLMQRGLSESLAGRFEVIHLPHWSYPEMRDAFGWSLDRYVYFGAYPGAAPVKAGRKGERWPVENGSTWGDANGFGLLLPGLLGSLRRSFLPGRVHPRLAGS